MSLNENSDPFHLFGEWLALAERSEANDPSAVALGTVDSDGFPNVRMVLLKGFDQRGFVFYTNFESAKGGELLARPHAALCFHWKSLRKSVRIQGPASVVSEAEADAYFAGRPREAQIGAWASRQSRPLESRFALEKAVAVFAARFGLGAVPRPPHWSGFRVEPRRIEFWDNRPFRLHDRLVFERREATAPWSNTRLYP